MVPWKIFAIKNAFKNWIRIACEKKPNTLVTKSYEFGVISIENNLAQIGMREYFLTKRNVCHNKIFRRMTDIFRQAAFEGINKENSKLPLKKLLRKW